MASIKKDKSSPEDPRESLRKKAKEIYLLSLKNGESHKEATLATGYDNTTIWDSGMGYVSLIGALMIIETERKIIIDNKAYRNTTTKRYYSKGLTAKQKWFLSRSLY